MSTELDLLLNEPGNNATNSDPGSLILQELEAIQLSPEQQDCHDQLLNYLTQQNNYPFAVLRGYAGTGKSTLTGKLIFNLKKSFSMAIGVCAPTHKAVKVLRKKQIPGVTYRTVHSMLALKEIVDYETGEITYKEDPSVKTPPPITELDVLFLDETSMLQDDLFNRLVKYMKDGLKVIFVGDPVQIPPGAGKKKTDVQQGPDAIPFLYAEQWGALCLSLQQVRRQAADNPILAFATAIRMDYKQGTFIPQHKLTESGGGVHLIPHNSPEETDLLRSKFCTRDFALDSDFMKVIAWRNVTVKTYNEMIRRLLYSEQYEGTIPKYVVGEKLVLNAPFVVTARNILANNEEVEILRVTKTQDTVFWKDERMAVQEAKFQIYSAYVSTDYEDLDEVRLPLIAEESEKDYHDLMELISKKASNAVQSDVRRELWKMYYQLKNRYAQVNYNYAITAHKSQGSTYTNCLVLQWDIHYSKKTEERNRILYVACTRPTTTLYIQTP